jgi:hypothetical protein
LPTTDTIDSRLVELYGEVDWRAARGVVHVAAIAESPRVAIAIGAHAPLSATDRFVLGFVRARCDVIVTTGAVLRAEPALVHEMGTTSEEDARFVEWRERVLGRVERPALGVLSHSGDLPSEHPALCAASSGFVWTSAEGRTRLGPRLGALEVVVADALSGGEAESGGEAGDRRWPGLAAAIHFARSHYAGETVALEAGPSSARTLYPPPAKEDSVSSPISAADSEGWVDELLLSRFEGRLAPRAVGSGFVSETAIRRCFPEPPHETRVRESSGVWRFQRYRHSR